MPGAEPWIAGGVDAVPVLAPATMERALAAAAARVLDKLVVPSVGNPAPVASVQLPRCWLVRQRLLPPLQRLRRWR